MGENVRMQFADSPEAARFRTEVRTWMNDHLVGDYRTLGTSAEMGAHDWHIRVAWEQELGRAGWLGLTWPKAFGGREVSVAEELVFAQEYTLANGPQRAGFFGEGLLGPTLITFGSPEQQARFLPPILKGEEYWCQGFSEPGAGSDLAGVRTTAVLDGDQWRIDGQKVWTSQAQFAQWIFVLCRTELDEKAHKALSYILVPIDQPGVEVRPLRAEHVRMACACMHAQPVLGPATAWAWRSSRAPVCNLPCARTRAMTAGRGVSPETGRRE